jgi:hypothetical protein
MDSKGFGLCRRKIIHCADDVNRGISPYSRGVMYRSRTPMLLHTPRKENIDDPNLLFRAYSRQCRFEEGRPRDSKKKRPFNGMKTIRVLLSYDATCFKVCGTLVLLQSRGQLPTSAGRFSLLCVPYAHLDRRFYVLSRPKLATLPNDCYLVLLMSTADYMGDHINRPCK